MAQTQQLDFMPEGFNTGVITDSNGQPFPSLDDMRSQLIAQQEPVTLTYADGRLELAANGNLSDLANLIGDGVNWVKWNITKKSLPYDIPGGGDMHYADLSTQFAGHNSALNGLYEIMSGSQEQTWYRKSMTPFIQAENIADARFADESWWTRAFAKNYPTNRPDYLKIAVHARIEARKLYDGAPDAITPEYLQQVQDIYINARNNPKTTCAELNILAKNAAFYPTLYGSDERYYRATPSDWEVFCSGEDRAEVASKMSWSLSPGAAFVGSINRNVFGGNWASTENASTIGVGAEAAVVPYAYKRSMVIDPVEIGPRTYVEKVVPIRTAEAAVPKPVTNTGAANGIFDGGRTSIDLIKQNPEAFSGKSAEQVAQMLKDVGYVVEVVESTKSKSGAMKILVKNTGEARNVTQAQVSPGGGRHGADPYVKISTYDQGIIKVVNGAESVYKGDGKETATIIFTRRKP